ncbi:MAG: hypothetical protein NTV79_00625, partial [Candidatus Aureabacteria bacterium]|nr:hypothetical protein [Candidatus Auribacterota bacterium]
MKWMLALVAIAALVMWTATGYGATVFNQGFDGYDTGTRPGGWSFNGCNDDTDTYTIAGYYGAASPSVRLADTDNILTEAFSVGASNTVQFWIRGTGTQGTSSLLVEEYYSAAWNTLVNLLPLPTIGTTEGPYALNASSTQIKFIYTQFAGEGYLAIDDVLLDDGAGAPTPTAVIPTPTAVPPTPIPPTPTAIIPTPTVVPPTPIIPTPTVVPPTPIPPTPTAVIPTPTVGPASPTPFVGPSPLRRVFDAANFDGAGGDDIGIWRAETAASFRIQNISIVYYGFGTDIPATGDYNGDGLADYAVFRPAIGRWYVRGQYNLAWGQNGDIPAPGDYNGDGTTATAVFRPLSGGWFVSGQTRLYFGANGDIPAPGDYNGDGSADIAVYRHAVGYAAWYVRNITRLYY